MTEVIRVQFLVNSNINEMTAQLNAAQLAAAKLEAQFQTIGSSGIKSVHAAFAEQLKLSGQYQVSTLDNVHVTREWGKSLDSQKLTMRQSVGALREYASGSQRAGSMISRVARENVRMMQSFALTSGPMANGRTMATIATPMEESLKKAGAQAMYTEERFKALNATMKNASTSVVNWGKNTQWAGRQMMVGMTMPIMIFGAASAMAFKKVDEELVRITKVYGDTLSGANVDKEQVRADAVKLATDIAKDFGVAVEESLALTASIAAVGYTGEKLSNTVKETTRLSLLGEVDREQAMKTTLSLQTAFRKSNEELVESINFLNAAENATSTSLQDMTEAIPRAGTVVKGLGGDVEDLTLYITAMREGGIGAAEGANALKSGLASIITPSKEAANYVKALGIDLKAIIEQGGGDLTATLLMFQNQLDKLDNLERTQVMSKLFGKHQMGRMLALFNNLGKEGSQTQKVFELIGYSVEDLAKTAQTELDTVANSVSGKFNRAWETLRANMAVIGETFLEIGTMALNFGSSILETFNGLSDGMKKFITWGTILAAGTGPLVMISGILANWGGHIVNFIRLMGAGLGKLGGINAGGYKMYDTDDAAKKLNATIEMGAFDAAKAMTALDNAIQAATAKLQGLFNTAIYGEMGLTRNGMVDFSKLRSEPLQSIAFGLETKEYNRAMKASDVTPQRVDMLEGGGQSRALAVQRMALETTMSEYLKGGVSPEQEKVLKGRGVSMDKLYNPQDRQAELGRLRSQVDTAFPDITQKFGEHVQKIDAEVTQAMLAQDGTRRQQLEEIWHKRGYAPAAANSLVAAGMRPGGDRYSAMSISAAVMGQDALVLGGNADPKVMSFDSAMDSKQIIESGHTLPDTLAKSYAQQMMVSSDDAFNESVAAQRQLQAQIDERVEATRKIAEVENKYLAGGQTLTKSQKDAMYSAKRRVIAGDQLLKDEVGKVSKLQEFNKHTDELVLQNKDMVAQNKMIADKKAEVQRKIAQSDQNLLLLKEKEAVVQEQQVAQQRRDARKAKVARGLGTASMLAGAIPMFTGVMGEKGDAFGTMAMTAGMGAMTGVPQIAAAAAAAGGALVLYKDLKAQSSAMSDSLKMSGISAEIFGKTLRNVADVDVDAFIKQMLGNDDKAVNQATEALMKFTEAINNATEGSVEYATNERLQDLSGGDSIWEKVIGTFADTESPLAYGPLQGWLKRNSPQDETGGFSSQDKIGATLKQRYSTSILGGATKEEAIGEVSAYAKKNNVAFNLKLISEELANIDSNKGAIETLSSSLLALKKPAQTAAENVRDVFDVGVIAQLSYNELGLMNDALGKAGVSWQEYVNSMASGTPEQKAFAEQIQTQVDTLGIDYPAAVQIVLASLDGLDVGQANFANKTNEQVASMLNAIKKTTELSTSAQDKIDAYNQKKIKSNKSAQMQNVDDAKEASDAAIEAAQDQSEAEIKAMEDAAEKRQKAMQEEIESVEDKYNKEIDALEKADAARQKAFDDEQKRIDRAKEERSSEIEYLRAMSEGRFYDASAIKNDMESTRQSWQIEDANENKADKNQAKIDALVAERDLKVETLNDQMAKQREHDQQMLENKRDNDAKMLEQLQKSEEKRLSTIEETNKKIDKSNKGTAVSMEEVVKEIVSSAKKGQAALNKTLDKYGLTQQEAMNLLVKEAGIAGTDAARVLGSSLKQADWKALAMGISAKLNDSRNAGQYFEKFWGSIDQAEARFGVKAGTLGGSPLGGSIGAGRSPIAANQGFTGRTKLAYGGYVSGPGTKTSDSIPAMLSNGEYVINARSVAKVGVGNLNKLNETGKPIAGFAAGGPVGSSSVGTGIAGNVVRYAMWDFIQSLVDKRVQMAKNQQSSEGIDMGGIPTGDWGLPTGVSRWTTYDGHGFARDYQVGMGTGVYSVGPGKVVAWNDGVNDNPPDVRPPPGSPSNWVLVWHNKKGEKYSTYYQHLQKGSVRVKKGDVVDHQTLLGKSGNSGNSSGPHLHFEVRRGWNDRYTGDWDASIQEIWNLLAGGYIGNEKNPAPDGPRTGLVTGYTNTMLNEYIDIYSKLGNAKNQAVDNAQKEVNSIAKMGDSKSPEAAKAFAKSILGRYGWAGAAQWKALENLWNKESGWKWYADNPTSDAYGIPQSLPGNKMRSAGSDWKTNPETQIKWGLDYIKSRYGSPQAAWNHSEKTNWYRDGGLVIPQLRKGATINYDNTLANLHRGESVLTAPLTAKLKDGVGVASSGDIIYNVDITVKEGMSEKQAENIVFGALDRHTAKIGRSR